jgi:hypothetical protein
MSYNINNEKTITIQKSKKSDINFPISNVKNPDYVVKITNKNINFKVTLSLRGFFELKGLSIKMIKKDYKEFQSLKGSSVYAEVMINEYYKNKNNDLDTCCYCNKMHNIKTNSKNTMLVIVCKQTSIRNIKIHRDCIDDLIEDINNLPAKFKKSLISNYLVD